MVFNVLSWNIEGKHYILKNDDIKKYLNKYDILFIHETHCTREMDLEIENYTAIQNQCKISSVDKPRGGCVMFIKNNMMKYVESYDKNFNDAIIVYLSTNIVICGVYVPPDNSKYFENQMDILETLSVYDAENTRKVIICGDLNARTGTLSNLHGYQYQTNPDTISNQHGRTLIDICQSNQLVPLNMLIHGETHFRTGFTYHKGNSKSQNDWIIVSKNVVQHVKEFDFLDLLDSISDHVPITVRIMIEMKVTLNQLDESISNVLYEPNNHSIYKKFKSNNIDLNAFSNTLSSYILKIENTHYDNPDDQAADIDLALRKSADICSKPQAVSNTSNELPHTTNTNKPNLLSAINSDLKKEYSAWQNLLEEKDPKRLWNKIDFNGKCKSNNIEPENTCNEFANYLEKRCSLPYEHRDYEGIESNIFNPSLDSKITGEEILEGATKMNRSSAARCGIPLNLLLLVIQSMLGVLVPFFNSVFTSKYPKSWVPFVLCLPKKMKLNIPCVRGISLKVILAKIYDTILKNRLERWLSIPEEQTAYQKGKACNLHVFFMRCLIAICKKRRITLFIGVTDFEAAFDYISRRNLFRKLVKLGIGMFMLKALMEMYKMTDAYVFLNGEYSHKLYITAGVLQGSASSTILFMAYTADIITLFKDNFPSEELLHFYHILLHADDSIILATSKKSLIEKFETLSKYCKENNIKLQLSKCCFLAINSKETANIEMEGEVIENKSEFVYLGSIITASGDVTKDIRAELKKKGKKLNQFFAFLSQNRNAPLSVKEKVLESCVVSTILYNCETWGDANLNELEKKYRKALKYMLGLRKSTCNELPYIELGYPTLKSRVYKHQLKFYHDCIANKDLPMQRFIIRKALDNNSSFIQHYIKLHEKYNHPEDIPTNSMNEMKEQVFRKMNQSKFESYLRMNPSLIRPDIYNQYSPVHKLQYVTRLRTVAHDLAIETGRHHQQRLPREERLCSCGEVEDETHFVLRCHHYSHIRQKYFEHDVSLEEVLNCESTIDYVHELFEYRKILTRSDD